MWQHPLWSAGQHKHFFLSLSLTHTHTHPHTHPPPHTHRQSFSHNHTQTQSSIALGTYLDILQNGDDQVNRYRYARPLICKSNNLFVQLNDLVLWNLTSPTAIFTSAEWIHKFMPTPVCCLFASAQWPLLYIINRQGSYYKISYNGHLRNVWTLNILYWAILRLFFFTLSFQINTKCLEV